MKETKPLTNEENYDIEQEEAKVLDIKSHMRKKYLKDKISELQAISKTLGLVYSSLRPFAKYYKISQLARHTLEVRDETVDILNRYREEFKKLN